MTALALLLCSACILLVSLFAPNSNGAQWEPVCADCDAARPCLYAVGGSDAWNSNVDLLGGGLEADAALADSMLAGELLS